jgi:phospholipid/cholesterol/gamma-HCH transport system substrate-binding protein
MVERAFGRGGPLAQVVSPYSPEASMFFTNVTRALQEGNDNYRWLNFIVLTSGPDNITDGIGAPIRDPLQARDPQPAPGQAGKERVGIPGGG